MRAYTSDELKLDVLWSTYSLLSTAVWIHQLTYHF